MYIKNKNIMIYGGKEIEINRSETVLDVIKDIDNTKNYFYIIKTPRCGGNRIKIGKSKTIKSRFASYANYYIDSNVYVLKLIAFNNINIGSGGKKPSEVFESLMKDKLKNIQNHKDKNDLTIPTEWYDFNHKDKIFKAFEDVKKSNEEGRTGVNTSTRSHKNMKIGDNIQVEWKLKNSRKTEWYDAEVLKITKDTYTVKYDEDDSVMTHPLKTPWRYVE